jgi:organic radical activating enzyme
MSYAVKEIFFTLQGEGANSGRAAVFCRFAGCNLWSGREQDRDKAVCTFCDTDFVGTDGPGGGSFTTPERLAAAIHAEWTRHADRSGRPYVVFTGGEPALQLDDLGHAEPLVGQATLGEGVDEGQGAHERGKDERQRDQHPPDPATG